MKESFLQSSSILKESAENLALKNEEADIKEQTKLSRAEKAPRRKH
jgi:hypothetical protein